MPASDARSGRTPESGTHKAAAGEDSRPATPAINRTAAPTLIPSAGGRVPNATQAAATPATGSAIVIPAIDQGSGPAASAACVRAALMSMEMSSPYVGR